MQKIAVRNTHVEMPPVPARIPKMFMCSKGITTGKTGRFKQEDTAVLATILETVKREGLDTALKMLFARMGFAVATLTTNRVKTAFVLAHLTAHARISLVSAWTN